MIPQAFINEWRQFAPWSSEAQIEQDLVLSRAIVEIFSHPLLANSLAFRGGTALHKLFVQPAARYSEDIDLVQMNAGPIGPILDALRERLNPWLGEPRWKKGTGIVTLTYRFNSENQPITPMRLKIEINTREHFAILGFSEKSFEIKSRWFSQQVVLPTFHLEELLATKLRALYQRKKGRDLFDLVIILKKFTELDIEKMLQTFNQYMSFEQKKISRAEFEANLEGKLNDGAFLNDILPLLPVTSIFKFDHDNFRNSNFYTPESNDVPYNPIVGVAFVQEKIISKLPGESWKRSISGS